MVAKSTRYFVYSILAMIAYELLLRQLCPWIKKALGTQQMLCCANESSGRADEIGVAINECGLPLWDLGDGIEETEWEESRKEATLSESAWRLKLRPRGRRRNHDARLHIWRGPC